MNFRDILSAELPGPRDDEPGSLREDILDELADHLACSYRRELLRGVDPLTARLRVLDRFGDPAAVARRLWFDAMRGKIMSRRILVGYSILLTILCAVLLTMNAIQASRAQRELTRALLAEHEARTRQQQNQEKMLQQIEASAKAAAAARSADWIPVAFRLVQEKVDGTPARDVWVTLGRGTGGSNKPDAMRRNSDASGRVDFGVVQPGDWEFGVHLPYYPGSGNWQATGTMNVVPGTSIDRAIICPRLPVELVKITPRVQWPEDLAGKGLMVELQLQNQGTKYQPDIHWSSGQFFWNLLLGPEPGESHKFGGNGSYLWRRGGTEAPVYADFTGLGSTMDRENWQPGHYRIQRLAILRAVASAPKTAHALRAELLAFWSRLPNHFGVDLYDEQPPVLESIESEAPHAQRRVSMPQTTLSDESAKPLLNSSFAANPAGTNEWTIVLPEELLRAARERLKAESGKK